MNNVIISGGGTGGHIFPAIAIANEIKRRFPDCKIHFVGAIGRMEMEKIPLAGYTISGLPIIGFQRGKWWKNLSLPIKILKSFWISKKILDIYKPQVVIGVGGYASAAIVKAAQLKKIPTFIQEQNSYAGITNKILGKKAIKICVAFDDMNHFFTQNKIINTGNPIRNEILNCTLSKNELALKYNLDVQKTTILAIGGSLGARSINQAIENSAKKLLEMNFNIIWQTGKNYAPTITLPNIYTKTFINEMNEVYKLADIIISRAGAISISELCCVAKPTILVPSPNVAEDHQTKNASALENKNACIILKDNQLTNMLLESILSISNDKIKAAQLAKNMLSLAKPNAAQHIVDVIIENLPK